jgi:FdhD protein
MPVSTSQSVSIKRWRAGQWQGDRDHVAVEMPVALAYNGVSHTVMLASPSDLEDFALGFSLTEGILKNPRELYDSEVELQGDGIVLHLSIAAERFNDLQNHRRSMAGRTGCGLCGAESLDQVVRDLPPVTSALQMQSASLQRAAANLASRQCLQQQTGASHAAAWIDAGGEILAVREDVGRHNALDKLIGALAKVKTDFASGAFLVTSRASYEMVQKTAAVGVGLLAAVSAPTSLAIRQAEGWNVTLVGFLRNGSHVAYTHDQRITSANPEEKIA